MDTFTSKTIQPSLLNLSRRAWLAQLSLISGLGLLGGQAVLAQPEDISEVVGSKGAQLEQTTAEPEVVFSSSPAESSVPVEPAFAEPASVIGAPAVESPIEPVRPANLAPATIPAIPEDYNSVFIDPTDYSIGATQAPEVVVTERSSGCQFSVGGGRSLPDAVCGQTNEPASAVAQGSSSSVSATQYAQTQTGRISPRQSVSIGPINISSAGVRISDNTTAQNRAYYNKATRSIVNLQQGRNFIFPLSIPSPITSLFGWRLHPIFGDQRFHTGTDIGAPQGTPVLAAQAGRVVVSDEMGGYGLTVVLRHGEKEDLESLYPHLSQLLVEPGEQVEQGDVIGLVGSTGNSTGPHLHFEMRQLTADGWVTVNTDDLVRQTMATLVQTLNNPLLALSEQAQQADGSSRTAIASEVLKVLSFRPAQPNAN